MSPKPIGVAAEPLPTFLVRAADTVGHFLHLPVGWLNNGPASQFQMGLPDGLAARLHQVVFGRKLTVYYIGRFDQIYFKTFASVDRGGYHVSDLKAMNPTDEELLGAARWCMTQDVSSEFRLLLKEMFNALGWKNVSEQL